jgi:Archaeal ADP-dependent phosphofructokinase/glucokinase
MTMKDIWRKLYRQNAETVEKNNLKILTGFDAGIDRKTELSGTDIDTSDTPGERHDRISSRQDLREALADVKQKGEEKVSETGFEPEVSEYTERLGGKGLRSARFLNRFGLETVFYSGVLSEAVSSKLDENIKCVKADGGIKIVDTGSAVSTTESYRDLIFTPEGSGKLRLVRHLKGFGPYFRKAIEEDFGQLEDEVDAAVFSGFHRADGNARAKIEKAARQLSKLEVPKHLDYRIMAPETSEKVMEELIPAFESISLDTRELSQVSRHLGTDTDKTPELQRCFETSKRLMEEGLERVHVYTGRFQAVFRKAGDHPSSRGMRDSMLWAWNCSVAADGDVIPEERDLREYSINGRHVHRLDPLERFAEEHGLENLVKEVQPV